jgi:sortase A
MESPMNKKRTKKFAYVGLILLFLIGLSIVLYPTLSDKWNRHRANQLITQYSEAVETEGVDYSAYLEAAKAYNESRVGQDVPDAFLPGDEAYDPDYEALLNINGDSIIGYIEIPAIDISIPIYHYTTEAVLEKGAGHLYGSSFPIAGESVHSVISAHRGLPGAKLFTDLNLLKEGDIFYVTVLSEKSAYEVDQILVVEPTETDALAIEEGENYTTLVTCTPYAVNTHRLLVRGHYIDYEEDVYEEQIESAGTKVRFSPNIWIHILCALLGVALALIFVGIITVRDQKKRMGKNKSAKANKEPEHDQK